MFIINALTVALLRLLKAKFLPKLYNDFILAEARRQGDKEFCLSKDELTAFLGLCILGGVLKERDEPIFNLLNEKYKRLSFEKLLSRNKFKFILLHIHFHDKDS